MCGPTGIGFLFGKSELLSAMPPFLGKPVPFKASNLVLLRNSKYDCSACTEVIRTFLFKGFQCILLLSAGGGEMISDVYLDHSTYAEPPSRLGVC